MVGVGLAPVLVLSGVSQGFSQGSGAPWQQALSDASLSVNAGEGRSSRRRTALGQTTLLWRGGRSHGPPKPGASGSARLS